jgi:hypothetical protein
VRLIWCDAPGASECTRKGNRIPIGGLPSKLRRLIRRSRIVRPVLLVIVSSTRHVPGAVGTCLLISPPISIGGRAGAEEGAAEVDTLRIIKPPIARKMVPASPNAINDAASTIQAVRLIAEHRGSIVYLFA